MRSLLERVRPSRPEIIDAASLLGLITVALSSFRSSYGGWAFLVAGLAFAAIGMVVAHAGMRLEIPLSLVALAAVAVFAVVGGVVALPHRAFLGFVPTPSSVLAALRTAATGWKELVTTVPPVGRTGDLMVIPVFTGMAAGFVSYVLARSMKPAAVAASVPAGVLALGIATGTRTPVSIVLHGTVFAVVTVAWLAWREHSRRPFLPGTTASRRQLAAAAGVLVLAGAAGYVLAPRMPMADASERDVWRQNVVPPFDPRHYPSPLGAYRQFVKPANAPEGTDEVMFTVEGLPEGVPMRLATMDTYDGLVWQVSAGDPTAPSLEDSGSFERVGAAIPADHDGVVATVTVTIGDYGDVWVPNVGEVVEIEFTGGAGGPERDRALTEQFRYNRATDTGASRLPLQSGDRYVMSVRLPVMLEVLANEVIEPSVPRLGPNVSVAEIAQRLVGPELLPMSDTGQRLDFVAEQMVKYGTYSDGDVASGHIRARAGHSVQRLGTFVADFPRTPLIGNAEQYAATYALLFRDLNRIPTRVVMGFRPEDASTSGPVEVMASQVDAWVEVPVAGKGWVGIFPTPPRDQTTRTSSSPQAPEPDYRTQNPPPPPLIDPEFDQPATAAGDVSFIEEEDEDAGGADLPADGLLSTGISRALLMMAGVPLVAFLLAVAVIAVLKVSRRRRRRAAATSHEAIANGWSEVIDFSIDAGRPVPYATTRREAALFVGSGTEDLASRADAAVWGAGEPTDEEVEAYWADLVAALRSMRSELSLLDRLRTGISTQSFQEARRRRRAQRVRG